MPLRRRGFGSRQPGESGATGDGGAASSLRSGMIPNVGAAARSFHRQSVVRVHAARAAVQSENPVGRARLKGFGALGAVVVAMTVIVATTLGSSGNREPLGAGRASGRAGHSRCCWIVAPGQTLSSIARQERVGLNELKRVNPRIRPRALRAGQGVRIPG